MAQATGLFGLTPDQFWELTEREFVNMAEGFRMREDIEWRRAATTARWIMSVHAGKKTPTVDKLLGKDNRKEWRKDAVTIEEKRATLSELEAALGEAVD